MKVYKIGIKCVITDYRSSFTMELTRKKKRQFPYLRGHSENAQLVVTQANENKEIYS